MRVHINVRHTKKGDPKDSFTVHTAECWVPLSKRAKKAMWEVTTISVVEDLAPTVSFGACALCGLDGSGWKFEADAQVSEAEGHALIQRRTFKV
jgi:hypothetical protein